MNEKQISVGCVVASLLWVAALGLWAASVVYDTRPLASMSIILAIAGGTATVRNYFVDQNKRIRNAIRAHREPSSVLPIR